MTPGGLAFSKDTVTNMGDVEEIDLSATPVLLHRSGVMICPQDKVLVVADLHFEKASSYAERGVFLPPYDTAATLAALDRILDTFQPELVIALGDSFHDRRATDRLPEVFRGEINRLQQRRQWIWIAGNHDPEPPADLDGDHALEIAIGNLVFRHEPLDGEAPGEVAGHLHPAARLRRRGRSVRRRCFATNGQRIVLPAFGALTGGLNVLDSAWSGIFPGRGFETWMMGRDRLYRVAAKQLLADKSSG